MKTCSAAILLIVFVALASAQAQEIHVTVQADQVLHPLSRYLTGACLEDVNHEVYGGLYSQMVFGESFQEPAPTSPLQDFKAYGGTWQVQGNELHFRGAPGDKLVSELDAFADGEVGVEVFLGDPNWSNVGLLVRVARAAGGIDRFDGYEIALNAAGQNLRLGRHRQNWRLIKDTPGTVPTGQWIPLVVRLQGSTIEVCLNGKTIIRHDDGKDALLTGTVGLRAFQSQARYRNLWVKTSGQTTQLSFTPRTKEPSEASGMWRALSRGNASGVWTIEKERPLVGVQSQHLAFTGGQGEVGVENQGLNRWRMYFVGGKRYEGLLWARAERPAEIWVALETADGATVLAEKKLRLKAGDWERMEFSLTPKATASQGRFAIKLKQPGAVDLGYAFLQPGPWGRFKDLPVRRDVAQALIDQGITVLRYGGSMINDPEYRWKKMTGPRDRRPPYHGTWYPYSSNGWGILDFMDFCEAAGFEYIPAFNMGETPQDMADFIEYAKGAPNSTWGSKRRADGHRRPYRLQYLELGNEERVDLSYAAKFEALARAIWAKDPEVILVVGDFLYSQRIADPCHVAGAAAGITNLAGQQRILQLAQQCNREVWFDLHVGTDGPHPDSTLEGMFSFADALDKMAAGAKHKVAVFEFNAGNHAHKRALANALALGAIERDGRLAIVTSANCLQPDGQNDNGWDQGLLFLNPSHVWLQPPGYVTQMFSHTRLAQVVKTEVTGTDVPLDVTATRSNNGKALVLQAVNPGNRPVAAQIHLKGFVPSKPTARVIELSGALDAVNTAAQPDAVVPRQTQWQHKMSVGSTEYTFPPHSILVLSFE
jgi:hypothetical protein